MRGVHQSRQDSYRQLLKNIHKLVRNSYFLNIQQSKFLIIIDTVVCSKFPWEKGTQARLINLLNTIVNTIQVASCIRSIIFCAYVNCKSSSKWEVNH